MLTKKSIKIGQMIPIQQQDSMDRSRLLTDIVIASILLAFTFPLLLLVALALKLEGPGPVLERRECIGGGGRRFQMLKFRTAMHDPRHAKPSWARSPTRIGEFLRYTRIEDLPQLINVLCGEMSIIDRDARSPSFLD
jgi:lipopolysaccharide/colanic/teichoic acid biosynthesis glycosyltransferase